MRSTALTEMLGVHRHPARQPARLPPHRRRQSAKGRGLLCGAARRAKQPHPGIYKRIETGSSSAIAPMMLYVDPVNYRKFIDLEKLGREVVAKTFQPAFDAELAKALANAPNEPRPQPHHPPAAGRPDRRPRPKLHQRAGENRPRSARPRWQALAKAESLAAYRAGQRPQQAGRSRPPRSRPRRHAPTAAMQADTR
jgi:hypothetical protein